MRFLKTVEKIYTQKEEVNQEKREKQFPFFKATGGGENLINK